MGLVPESRIEKYESAVSNLIGELEKREAILRAAVAWFEQHRPQWGPGTLPTWYSDAHDLLRDLQKSKST